MLLLLLCFAFQSVLASSITAEEDELQETNTITCSSRTIVQLTSQVSSSKVSLKNRDYGSSVLRELLIPINQSKHQLKSSTTTSSSSSSIPSRSPLSSLSDTHPSVIPVVEIPSVEPILSASSTTLDTMEIITSSTSEQSTSKSSNDPIISSESSSFSNIVSTQYFENETVFDNYTQSNETIEDLEDLSFSEEEKAQFLSFEEWKRKKGVDSHSGQQKEPETYLNRIPKTPNVKDSIGEEMEIDISNFFDGGSVEPEGKIYKDKFNFASFDCAATIVKTNSEAKGATSILFENKDSYLLNPCSAPNKFVVIELCQDILVDSVVMGNFEFFSSTFKKIQISVSETFPVAQNGWKILGQFDAKDIRDFQTFQIENPMIWAKYFRVEILEHYGSEFYCPLSVVRVHGRTMMQEYKQEEALQKSNTAAKELESSGIKEEQDKTKAEEAISAASESLVSEMAKSSCSPTNNSSKIVDCILTNKTVNNSIRDIQKNLTNLTDEEINDECLVSLPQLKFDELFDVFQQTDKCETIELYDNKSSSIPVSTQSPNVNTNTGTQESIYKNIMKRLSLLESNATLSVLYIEEQSKLLSTAFSNLEKKQSLKFDKLIDTFNTSIYNQLENLSTLYSLFQKQTDELLTSQRLKHEHLLYDANLKIEILTSDLKFQKILSFINVLVVICVLIYVVITRDTYIEEQYVNDDKYWINVSKRRITSTGSRLKANIQRMYYNSDGGGGGGYGSPRSLGPSDEEVEDGHTTPSSNEKQETNSNDNNNNSIVNAGDGKSENRPLTPENSDHE